MRLLTPLIALAALTGCPTVTPIEGPLETGFEDDFTITTACSDTTFHAWNDDGSVALSVTAIQFLSRSAAVDDTHYEETLEIGVDDIDVRVDLGTDVHFNFCTDALMELDITDTYEAVSGSVTLSVDWPADDFDPTGSFTLTDLVLEDGNGATVTLESFGDDELQITRFWGG